MLRIDARAVFLVPAIWPAVGLRMWYPLHLLYGRLWPTPPMYAWPGIPACWNAVTGAAARPCILALHFERTKWPGILAVAWCVHHRMALASCGPALECQARRSPRHIQGWV